MKVLFLGLGLIVTSLSLQACADRCAELEDECNACACAEATDGCMTTVQFDDSDLCDLALDLGDVCQNAARCGP
jgi:hypothetical protein